MPADQSVAIVIPVLNEADNLSELLDDCAAQELAPTEVIVVDAGSSDGTPELVAGRQALWPALRLLRVPGATAGRGRNAGIRDATSELIATLDADSRVDPTWLAALTTPLAEGTYRVVAVGVSEPDARSSFERAAGWLSLRAFKAEGKPGPVGRTFLPAGRNGYCFRRGAWAAVGGYPEIARVEDKLLLQKFREHGYNVVVSGNALVRWRPRRSPRELYQQYRNYGHADAVGRIDRQNEIVTLCLYAVGAGLGVSAAWRSLRDPRALMWIPAVRITADLGKIHGFLSGTLARFRRAST